jgi:hypothetical protein
MKQNLAFAVILLAMLSMINAIPLHKRKTEFSNCSGNFPATLDVTALTPDPIQAGQSANFTISGNFTGRLISSDFKQYIVFANGFASGYYASFSQDICSDNISSDLPRCPLVEYNTTMIIQVPADLPTDDYVLTLYVWNEDYGTDWLACTQALIGK